MEGGRRAEEAGVCGGPVFLDAGTSQQRSDPVPSPLSPTHVAPFSSQCATSASCDGETGRGRRLGHPYICTPTHPLLFASNKMLQLFPKGTTVRRQ